MNSDFRVKENSDGTISFQSVIAPAISIGIAIGATAVTNLSANLMVSVCVCVCLCAVNDAASVLQFGTVCSQNLKI